MYAKNNDTCGEMHQLVLSSGANNSLYLWAMRSISAANVWVTVVSVWMLLRHTPPEMAFYRWYLLNVALTAFALDSWNSVFYAPILYLPSSYSDVEVNLSLGVLAAFGEIGALIGLLVYTQLMGCLGLALIYAFLYRYASMSNRVKLLQRKSVIGAMAVLQLLYSSPCTLMTALCSVSIDSEQGIAIPECWRGHSLSLVRPRLPPVYINVYSIFVCVTFVVLLCLVYLTNRSLIRLREKASNANYVYQRKLLASLFVQLIMPFTLIAMAYGALILGMNVRSLLVPALSRFAFGIASSHTTANGLLMMLTVKPYRRALFRMLLFWRGSAEVSSLAAVNMPQQSQQQQQQHVSMQRRLTVE